MKMRIVKEQGGTVRLHSGRHSQGKVEEQSHTGRALHTQLEGIRSLDRGLSDAAVALSD